jgi:hypothetical protein
MPGNSYWHVLPKIEDSQENLKPSGDLTNHIGHGALQYHSVRVVERVFYSWVYTKRLEKGIQPSYVHEDNILRRD